MSKPALNELRDDLRGLLLSTGEQRIFLALLVLIIIAKGIALLPLVYSSDDYTPALFPDAVNQGLLAQGRYTAFVVRSLHAWLGIDATYANPLIGMLTFAAWAWIAVITARLWRINDRPQLALAAGLLLCLHPYTTPQLCFKVSTAFYNLVLAYLALTLARFRTWHLLAAVSLMVLALGKNQTIVNFLLVTLLVSLLLALQRASDPSLGRRLRTAVVDSGIVPRLLMLGIAIPVSLGIAALIRSLSQVPADPRGRFLALAELPRRCSEVLQLLREMLVMPEPGQPQLVKLLAALLLVLAALALVRTVVRQAGSLTEAAAGIGIVVVLLGAGLLSVMAVTLPLAGWFTVRRVLASFGILLAGALALCWGGLGQTARRLVMAVAWLLVLAYLAASNHLLTDQMVVNLRDLHKTNRILARLEAQPGYRQIQRLIVLGGDHYEMPGESAVGAHASAFSKPWKGESLLYLLSGKRFHTATTTGPEVMTAIVSPNADDRRLAEQYYLNHRPWPDAESVTISNGLAIVCLPATSSFFADLRRRQQVYQELQQRFPVTRPIFGGIAFAGLARGPVVGNPIVGNRQTLSLVLDPGPPPRPELTFRLSGSRNGQTTSWHIVPTLPLAAVHPARDRIVIPLEIPLEADREPGRYQLHLQLLDRNGAPLGDRIDLGPVQLGAVNG